MNNLYVCTNEQENIITIKNFTLGLLQDIIDVSCGKWKFSDYEEILTSKNQVREVGRQIKESVNNLVELICKTIPE